MKKKRGSAIVIAVLLITAIGMIAFSFGQVLVAELSNATILENSIPAYYSAESGIEEGFLRYRLDRNAEVPSNFSLASTSINNVYREDLAANTSKTGSDFRGIDKNGLSLTPQNQTYDLRMGYIGTNGLPFYGQDLSSETGLLTLGDINDAAYGNGSYSFLQIPKDEAIKIDLSDLELNGKTLKLYLRFDNLGINGAYPDESLTEAKLIVKDTSGTKEYKKLLSSISSALGSSDLSDKIILTLEGSGNTTSGSNFLNWKVYSTALSTASFDAPLLSAGSKVTLFIKPLNYDARIGLITSQCVEANGISDTCKDNKTIVSGPNTTITSTGYYGNTTRTLEANIDRQSGTAYDLFDYVIYKAL